ncbi:MAG: hypothetical protein KBS86_03430 [Proteobacteria bacterium]|nr:hypothetical protein [Candidatus Enterousia scatequi]
MKFGAFFVCGATILSTMAAFAEDKSSTLTTQQYVDSMYDVIDLAKADKTDLATKENAGNKYTAGGRNVSAVASEIAGMTTGKDSKFPTIEVAEIIANQAVTDVTGRISVLEQTTGTLKQDVKKKVGYDVLGVPDDIDGTNYIVAYNSDEPEGTTIVDNLVKLDTAIATKANTANLATVATTGSYEDLDDKPTIPAAQVNSDWNATSGVAQILNKPTIPTVTDTYSATSGDAMSGKAVASAISGKANTANLATVATTGSYKDLDDKPTIPAAQVNSDWNATSGVAQILNKPTLGSLATLSAVSGGEGGTITDGTIAAVDLADGAVTSAKILDNTIVDVDIASDAKIGTSKIDFGSLAQVGTGLSAVGDGVYGLTATITNGVATLKWELISR